MDEVTQAFVVREVKRRFPEDALLEVRLLNYGEDPAVEPGAVGIRVTINPDRYPDENDHPLHAFRLAHHDTLEQLRSDLSLLPRRAWLEFQSSADDPRRMRFGQGAGRDVIRRLAQERPAGSTPVTARLDAGQLETLDTLITAGIAANRAEAVRWALDRIRERPAYARLRERAREIDELKEQF
jgi:hypothetical protein